MGEMIARSQIIVSPTVSTSSFYQLVLMKEGAVNTAKFNQRCPGTTTFPTNPGCRSNRVLMRRNEIK